MKSKLLAVAAATRLSCLVGAGVLLSVSPGMASTYYSYTGGTLTTSSFSCSGGIACNFNPDLTQPVGFVISSGFDGLSQLSTGTPLTNASMAVMVGGDWLVAFPNPPPPTISLFAVLTLSNGLVTDWNIGGGLSYSMVYNYSISTTAAGDVVRYNNWFSDDSHFSYLGTAPPGVWTGGSSTPLPAALPLFATGIGVLGLLGWRRKRKQAA